MNYINRIPIKDEIVVEFIIEMQVSLNFHI